MNSGDYTDGTSHKSFKPTFEERMEARFMFRELPGFDSLEAKERPETDGEEEEPRGLP